MTTKERLAQKLHELGLLDLEREARAGAFDDYENEKYAMPKAELVQQLTRAMADRTRRPQILELIKEVIDGKYDNTREEGEAWFQRQGKLG